MKSSKIIANIPLKLICEEKCITVGIPNSYFVNASGSVYKYYKSDFSSLLWMFYLKWIEKWTTYTEMILFCC